MKQQVHGNVTGVRDTLIEALGQLYDYEVDEDTFLPRELMQVLARFTGVLNREIAVYITRDGEVNFEKKVVATLTAESTEDAAITYEADATVA